MIARILDPSATVSNAELINASDQRIVQNDLVANLLPCPQRRIPEIRSTLQRSLWELLWETVALAWKNMKF